MDNYQMAMEENLRNHGNELEIRVRQNRHFVIWAGSIASPACKSGDLPVSTKDLIESRLELVAATADLCSRLKQEAGG